MLAWVNCGATVGLDGALIRVEVDVASRGFPSFTVVGLPSKAVDEAKDRVRTALVNSSFRMPDSRITVNLAPADIPKSGSGYDVPIALGILACTGVIPQDSLLESVFVGELSLEGKIQRIPGIISIAFMALEKGLKNIFVPDENVQEAAFAQGLTIIPVSHLKQLVDHINGLQMIKPYKGSPPQRFPMGNAEVDFDFSEIRGQHHARRALEIAAAGFHNVHFTGPPGAGKTMLSRAFPSILPALSDEEVLEVTKIYSVSGLLQRRTDLRARPFRAPHNTTSRIGLIGGGSHPLPGEISLAHRGVLFLDEFSEFPGHVIESLRQPLEDGTVTISRAAGSLTYPARFILIAASNPCPCGYYGHPQKKCTCPRNSITLYKKRISGPIMDRIDLHVSVTAVEESKLIRREDSESSAAVHARVTAAHTIQQKRFTGTKVTVNSHMSSAQVRQYCGTDSSATSILRNAIATMNLSARSYFKTLKIARTIADLSGTDLISSHHIAEALQFRKSN